MQFTLTSEEGLPLRGNLTAPRDAEALLVVIHGFKGFKDWGFFPWLSQYLSGERIAVCRYNGSRSGIGENPETFDRLDLVADDTFAVQLADLRTVTRHAQSRVDCPTFLLGHGRGGGVAVFGATDVAKLRGVIAWNPIVRPSADILASASKLHVPLLIVQGGNDETVPKEESIALEEAAREPLRVMIASATHTFNAVHPMNEVPRQLELAAALTCRFIAGYAEQ